MGGARACRRIDGADGADGDDCEADVGGAADVRT
jgi:hypothetical protein